MKYYEEKENAVIIKTYFASFHGDVRKWKEAYFQLLSYKNTFSSLIYKVDIHSTQLDVFVKIIASVTVAKMLNDMMESIGYRNIAINPIIACFLEPKDWEEGTEYII